MRLHECCRGTSKCLQSCWGLEKLVLVSWECHAVAWHYGLYEIWRQACQWFGFALRLCSWSRMLAPGNSMEADLHTPRFPYVLIIYSLPVLLFATLCSSSFSGHIFLHFYTAMVYSIFTPHLFFIGWSMWTPLGITPPAFSVCWFRHGCLYLCQHWHWGKRGAHWVHFKPQKVLWFWRPMCLPPQCQHDIKSIWSLLLAWRRMQRLACFAVWRKGTLC